MSKTDTLLAFLGGAAIGAVIALLLAPAKGEDTRTRLADYLRQRDIHLDRASFDRLVADIESRLGIAHPDQPSVTDQPSATDAEPTPPQP